MKKIKSFLKDWWLPLTIGVFFFFNWKQLISFFSIEVIKLYYHSIGHPLEYDASVTGTIGDTFGGTVGPIVALIASYLTFIAFWAQYKANEQQKRDLQIERFESKFYNLIEIHRNNVNEIMIGKSLLIGRKAFISMFNELKFVCLFIDDYYFKSYSKDFPDDILDDKARFNIGYLIFFFGIGPNSSLIVQDLIGEKNRAFFSCLEVKLKANQKLWKEERLKHNPIAVNFKNSIYNLDIHYKPYCGHMSRLSHYLRNLFQLVKYIDDADSEIFSYEVKYNYAATVRSQLSTHEQLLLFYNAISILGEPWLKDPNYLKKYCMVKSMPLTLANFSIDPIALLGERNEKEKTMFEWNEIKERLSK